MSIPRTPEQKKRHAEYMREWYHRSPEKNRATANASYKRNFAADPEKFRIRNRKWRENNPEKMQELRDAWLDKGDNKEKMRLYGIARAAERRKLHPEKVSASLRAWKLKNKEAVKAYQKQWSKEHATDRAIYQRARQVKITGVKIDKTKISNWESRICPLCKLLIEGKFHVDHKTPLIKGGSHIVGNLQLTHPFCNLSKKDKLVV